MTRGFGCGLTLHACVCVQVGQRELVTMQLASPAGRRRNGCALFSSSLNPREAARRALLFSLCFDLLRVSTFSGHRGARGDTDTVP